MVEHNDKNLNAYTKRVLATAVYEEDNGEVFGSIPDMPGVWGAGEDQTAAEAQLRIAVAGAYYLRDN